MFLLNVNDSIGVDVIYSQVIHFASVSKRYSQLYFEKFQRLIQLRIFIDLRFLWAGKFSARNFIKKDDVFTVVQREEIRDFAIVLDLDNGKVGFTNYCYLNSVINIKKGRHYSMKSLSTLLYTLSFLYFAFYSISFLFLLASTAFASPFSFPLFIPPSSNLSTFHYLLTFLISSLKRWTHNVYV